MRKSLCWILGTVFIVNGLAMLMGSETWYALTPGVTATGPFNVHFIRDVGAAYLVSGGALIAMTYRPVLWPAAMAGAIFQVLHALTHVWDTALGRVAFEHVMSDLVLVVLPALLSVWLASPPKSRID